MRPLYIDGSPGCRVVLEDPALRVSLMDQADRLFPLTRISQVVCRGVVEWSMSALLACADAGIAVLFLEKNGKLRAKWLGRSGERQAPAQRLVDLFARTDGPELYQNWTLSMEKLAARSFARRIGLSDWQEAPVARLRAQLAITLGSEGRHCANLLRNLLHAELLGWLSKAGFSGGESGDDGAPDFAEFLSGLLIWDFYPELLASDAEDLATAPMQAMARLLEQRADRCHTLFRGTINKLHQFLVSIR